MKHVTFDRQSLFDIAIQRCGSVEAAFEMALLNDKSVVDDLVIGAEIELPPQVQKETVEYFTNKQLIPATALDADSLGFEGINYMGVEYDFVVY